MDTRYQNIVNFLHELSVMKRRNVSGFDQFVKQNHCTLAAHAYRAAMIGVIIANEEGANEAKVCMMMLVHENAEIRTGDPDFIASKYGMKPHGSEKKAFKDQVKNLQESLAKKLYYFFKEKEKCESLEAKVAWDADILDQIMSAKEFYDNGVKGAKTWLKNKYNWHTKTGEKIFRAVLEGDSNDWLESIV